MIRVGGLLRKRMDQLLKIDFQKFHYLRRSDLTATFKPHLRIVLGSIMEKEL